MSERMNKERAREILQEWKNGSVKFIQQGGLMEKAMEKDFSEYQQALDIAIESLENKPKKASITLEELKNKYDKKLEKALAECETGKQANAICEVTNILIDYILDNEWVDVRDRLPSEDNTRPTKSSIDVLVCFNDGLITKGYYSYVTDMWITFSSKFKEEPIAWKPLPQPYERKE